MRKVNKILGIFLVLVVGLFLASTINLEAAAQGEFLETFENVELPGSYSDGSFTGVNGVVWTYVHSRDEDTFPIDGKGIMLRRADEPSSLSATFTNGIGEFSFEYRKAYTGKDARKYAVEVTHNGNTTTYDLPEFGSGSGAQDTIYEFTQELNLEGEVVIEIYATGNTGNQQATFDNFAWTEHGDVVEPVVEYTITFYDDEGILLETLVVVEGEMPSPQTPTKAETATHKFEFDGWDPELVVASEDAIYHATFKATEKVLYDYTETFDASNATTEYGDGSFTGVNGVVWTYVHSRNEGLETEDDYHIDGKGIMLRRVDESSSLSATFTNGIGEFSFEYRKAFTGGTPRKYVVAVTHNENTTTYDLPEFGSGSGAQDTIYEFTQELNLEGEVVIEIYATGNTGNQQATFDNFKWTTPNLELIGSIEGASIRTDGDQGLRFYAKVLKADDIEEKGFYLLFGQATIDDLQAALDGPEVKGKHQHQGKDVIKVEVPGVTADNKFSVVLTGIPEQGYLDGLTVIPYVIAKGETEASFIEPVTRSVGEVAIKMAQEAGELPEGVKDVLNSIEVVRVGFIGENLEVAKGMKDSEDNYVDLEFYDVYHPETTEEITLPIPEERLGFTFGGWYDNDSYTGSPVASITIDEVNERVLLYYAKWEELPAGVITYVEDFSFITSSSTSYSEEIGHTDANGFTWDLLGRPGGATGFGLGNSADGSYIKVTATGGISSFSIDIQRLYTNSNARSVELFVNGVSKGSFALENVSTDVLETWTVDNINISGDVIIELRSTSPGKRGAMDVVSFEWTTYTT